MRRIASLLERLRKNHALEHATIHVLSQRHLNLHLLGRTDFWGFTLLGNVPTEEVASAALEALQRLQRGESELAVHPRCGTNLATSAILAGFSSFIAMSGQPRSRWEKLPRVLLATMGALLVAQPLGLLAQQHITTTPSLEGVRLGIVLRQERGRQMSHRVTVEHS